MLGRPEIPLNEKPEKPRQDAESILSRVCLNLRMYKIAQVYRDYQDWLQDD